MEPKEIKYKTNFFSPENALSFSTDKLELFSENKLTNSIRKDEIKDIRYGVSWIQGIDFTIGRVYCIDVGNKDQDFIKIRLRSLYGVHKMKLGNKYNNILDLLYDFYINNLIESYLIQIEAGTHLELAGTIFTNEGVNLKPPKSEGFITWEELNTRAYSYYFTLASRQQPDFYKAFTYLSDWNGVLVYHLSQRILEWKGFKQ